MLFIVHLIGSPVFPNGVRADGHQSDLGVDDCSWTLQCAQCSVLTAVAAASFCIYWVRRTRASFAGGWQFTLKKRLRLWGLCNRRTFPTRIFIRGYPHARMRVTNTTSKEIVMGRQVERPNASSQALGRLLNAVPSGTWRPFAPLSKSTRGRASGKLVESAVWRSDIYCMSRLLFSLSHAVFPRTC